MNRVIFGDCRDTMRDLKAQGVRVQCCVTSPPYFGLRDYGHPGQIGLEKTPAEYVAALVDVFEGVRELLADDGVLWLNLGDSYAGYHGNKNSEVPTSSTNGWTNGYNENKRGDARPQDIGLKPKNLIGIPWRVAFALQADGWYLRQDIIWHKPNPMPESVTDRCTKAHEYLFLLTKSERYFFDHVAIQEPAAPASLARWAQDIDGQVGSDRVPGKTNGNMKAVGGRSRRDSFKRDDSKRAEVIPGQTVGTHRPDREESSWDTEMRNRRSVWTVPTQPYSGAHFAVFPPALIEPCILAGSRPGDLVLDPFMGSGTTAQVAQALGRKWIGCELNPEYEPLQKARTAQAALAI
jgi:DNA modification methylase